MSNPFFKCTVMRCSTTWKDNLWRHDLRFCALWKCNVLRGENPGQRISTEPGLYVTKNLGAKWSKAELISSSSDADKFIPDFEGRIWGELKSKRLVNKAEISPHWDPRSSPVSRMIPTAGDFQGLCSLLVPSVTHSLHSKVCPDRCPCPLS